MKNRTSGGSGGATTTVSSLAALKSAVADDIARIVVVTGTITGNEAVAVGSNKSIVGRGGASKLQNNFQSPILPTDIPNQLWLASV